MAKVLLFVFLLIGLTAVFQKVAEWFQDTKNINIVPPAIIEIIAVLIFMFSYGGSSALEIVLMWVSILVVLAIVVLNLSNHGIKDGLLASLAELVFGISAALIIVCVFIANDQRKKQRRK